MRKPIDRRQFLRGMGVALAVPAFGAAAQPEAPRRMLAICNNLGLLDTHFFPKTAGPNYELSPYLELLKEYRKDFTVFSGVSHPDVDGSHASYACFLSAAPHPANGGFRNSISLDQFMAEHVGVKTRIPSLALGVNVTRGQRSLTVSGAGVMIPCEHQASGVYRRLFLQGTPEEVERQVARLKLGGSVMDAVADDAGTLKRNLNATDRQRLDQYVTGVRELEQRLHAAQEWERKPKPVTKAPEPKDPPTDRDYMEKLRLMYEMARLAFESDSTRLVTLLLESAGSPAIDLGSEIEITDGYHNLSHHGKDPSKLKQLEAIDRRHMTLLGELLGKLKSTSEGPQTLLDRTMVLYGSNLGDANKHTTTNLPILLAGGGFKHGQHLAFDQEKNYPLPNLFVSMIQRIGIESDKFASATGTMRGLQMNG